MSDILHPIHDRSRRPLLSETDAMAIEWARLTYQDAMREREERIIAELAGLRLDNAALAERNDELSAALAAMTSRALRDRERRIVAEQGHTLWLGALALVTLAAVVWAVTVWR